MWYDLCTGHYQCEQIDGLYWMSPFSGCNCLSSQRESVMCPLVRSNFQWCVNIKIGLLCTDATSTSTLLSYLIPRIRGWNGMDGAGKKVALLFTKVTWRKESKTTYFYYLDCFVNTKVCPWIMFQVTIYVELPLPHNCVFRPSIHFSVINWTNYEKSMIW